MTEEPREMAAALQRGCVECKRPFTRGDLENDNLGFWKDEPNELMHGECQDAAIQRALAYLVKTGQLEKKWDQAAGEWAYRKTKRE